MYSQSWPERDSTGARESSACYSLGYGRCTSDDEETIPETMSKETFEESTLKGQPFYRSVVAALDGIRHAFTTQRNFRIHAFFVFAITTLGFILHFSTLEWLACILVMALVVTTELLNSAIETVVDLVSPDYHKLAGEAKDLAAGAVLIASIAAIAVGAIVFIPRLLDFMGQLD